MKFRSKVDKVLEVALITILSIMVLNVLWQVTTRFIMGNPSSFTDELARYLMIWLGVLGAAYVSGKNMHVAIDILPQQFSLETQKKFKFVVFSMVILFAFFAFFIGGLRLVYITYTLNQYSPGMQMPLAAIYFVIPLSGLLIVYYKISDILNLK
ncbi:TRAP transporter small permease [Flavobacterium orientale]|uniref:C4-dicarboxylate ABC transporter permease n=1 Tax=Flavobacterium orientale TaxID=1756020 RepID=A0A917DBV3_9FLAO|nr:TRAP transporter small permease [Flavobacterium orientale]GGD23645.1 C4-dicarboxylate ABC transporter permease [Flavobacterium orientale]